MTTFAAMRLHLITPVIAVGLAVLLSACAGSGDSPTSNDVGARETEQAALEAVREAVPLVVQAISGTQVEVEAAWTSCMPQLSWKYDGAGIFTAPEGEATEQLESIRTALVEAGFTDVSQVDGQVAVERDGVTLSFAPHLATGNPKAWQLSFRTECLSLTGDDKDYADSDTRTRVDGLG